MSLAVLALICLATQVVVVGAVYYFLTAAGRRPRLIRGIGLFLFACLESAILLHLINAHSNRPLATRDILIDISLASLVALAFGFGNSILSLLHRSRRALLHSDSLSSTLFEQSCDPVFVVDPNGNLLEVNRAAYEQLGYSKGELLRLQGSDLIHPDDMPTLPERMTAMVPGEIFRTSVRMRRKDGSWMHSDSSSRRLDDQTFLIVSRDVTNQARQQRSLERFAEVSASTGQQFFTLVAQNLVESLDLEHIQIGELLPGRTDRARTLAFIIDGQPAANIEYDLAGTPCGAILGKAPACYPTHAQELFPEAAMLARIGAESYVGTPLFTSNGSPLGFICALSRKPIVDQAFCQTVLVCYSHRVESEIERMRADEALRESEERYSNVVNVAPFGMHMYRLEEDGRLILEAANPAADWLLGIDHSGLIGKTVEEAFPGLVHTEVPEQYRRIAALGERWRNESVTYKENKIDGAFEVVAFQRSPMKMAAIFINITDRKKSEEALRESEAGLANAQRITHIGNWSVDPVTWKTVWSAEMYRMCGMNPKEKAPTFDEYLNLFVHPDDREMVRTALTGLAKGRVHQPLDYRIVLSDGRVRICQVQSTVEFGPAGQPVRIAGTTQDITDRKASEDALRSSEERYRSLFEGTSEAIFILRDYSIVDSNSMAVMMYGCVSKEDFLDTPPWQLSPPLQPDGRDSQEKAKEYIGAALAGTPQCFYWKHAKKDGAAFDAEVSMCRIDIGGEVFVQGLVRDITDRKRAEESLRILSDRLALATDSAGIGIWDLDLATNKLVWDDSMYRLHGVDPASFACAYEAWQSCVHPDDRERANAEVQQALQGVKEFDTEFRILKPDGAVRYIKANGFVQRDNDGRAVRMLGTNWDITDRKQAEEARFAELARFSGFSNASQYGMGMAEPDGRITFVNPTLVRMLGEKTAEDCLGKHFPTAYYPPSMTKKLQEEVLPALMSVGHWHGELELQAVDGRSVPTEENYFAIRDENGQIQSIADILTDITERKLSEERLRESEQKFSAAFRTSPVAMALSSPEDGIYIDINDAFHQLLGYTLEETVGKTARDLGIWVTPDERDRLVGLLTKNGRIDNYEGQVRTKDGRVRTGLFSADIINVNGRPHCLTLFHDITERKQAEEELQRSFSLVRATLESTADGILVVDRQGNVAGYNQKFMEHWRIPVTLAQQKDDARLIAYVLDQLKDPDGFVRKVTELYTNPAAESFDLLEFRDGRHFERYSVPQRLGDEIIGRVWSFRDVTERKRAEMDRTRLEEQLRLSQKLETIGTLAAGIAHDFNNLLVPVIGYTELADSDIEPDDPKHDHLAEVLKAAYRAKSLVGQILAFSRQQSGESKVVRLEEVVEDAARLLRSTLEPNISLETTAETDLPQLFADATQLHQVIMNLGVNASHAMKNGGRLSIAVSATPAEAANCDVCGCQLFGRHLELCVSDTGHGMDQATLRRIFDPFFTTKPVGEGTGLGLAVTHGIVARHGGHICARSEVGRGTAFHIYLPAVEPSGRGTLLSNTEKILAATQIPVS